MQTLSAKLSPIQLELLKVYSFNPSEEDLLAIKTMFAAYFAKKLVNQVDEAVEQKGVTEATLNLWLCGHE